MKNFIKLLCGVVLIIIPFHALHAMDKVVAAVSAGCAGVYGLVARDNHNEDARRAAIMNQIRKTMREMHYKELTHIDLGQENITQLQQLLLSNPSCFIALMTRIAGTKPTEGFFAAGDEQEIHSNPLATIISPLQDYFSQYGCETIFVITPGMGEKIRNLYSRSRIERKGFLSSSLHFDQQKTEGISLEAVAKLINS